MNKAEFHFDLPEELIAQTPLKNRSESRMMVLNRLTQTIEQKYFYDILDYFSAGDVLVRNNTRVIPARLFGVKEETGAHVELLLLKQEGDIWECLVGNAKVVKLGTVITFGSGQLKAKCVTVKEKGLRDFEMIYTGVFYEVLDQLGQVPLPPYIKEKLEDKERYQTVYAKIEGSAAAPTAGLHFTTELFQQLKDKGVEVVDLTLHVGLGTFRPMDVDQVEEHHMHSEYYELSAETAQVLQKAKKEKRKIIAIGTTSIRTLETVYQKFKEFKADSGMTNIFIYPGITIESVNGLITNFHLPDSTLILLVSAFAGTELIKKAYQQAIEERYRFFSFGDAMLIL